MNAPTTRRTILLWTAAALFSLPAAKKAEPPSPQAAQEDLVTAARRGEVAQAQAALAAGADPKAAGHVGKTPLHYAAERGHLEISRLLLSRGADPNAFCEVGETPLLLAAAGRHGEIVKLMLAKGGRTDLEDPRGRTLLHVAAVNGYPDAIRFLLDRGAEVDALDKYDNTPLILAAKIGKAGNDLATVTLLVERGADPKARGQSRATALHEASISRNTDPRLIEFLLSKGLDINAKTTDGRTPLMNASFHGAERTAKLLLSKGADPNLEDDRGRTALDYAEEHRRQEVIELLTAAGARPGSGQARQGSGALSRRRPAPAREPGPAQDPAPERPTLSSDADEPSYKLPENEDNFALVVGIQRYNGLPEASFAERDAVAMRRHLAAMGYPERNIFTLIGPGASRAGLAKNLETKLPRLVNERSTVFFYYSGHGAPDPATGEAYLVPADGDPEFLKDTAYSLAELHRRLGALKARKVLVVVDSCFSGVGGRSVLARGTRPLVTKLKPGLTGSEKLLVMSASEGHQISGTAEEQGHGLFTYYFLKGLNGAAARDGRVTAQGLYDYLKPKVMDDAGRHNRDQTPQLLPAAEGAAEVRLR